MREALREINNVRSRFHGIVERFGERTSYGHPKPMMLVRDITDSHGRMLTDHVWFDLGKWIEELNLKPGDVISFDARVRPYVKGYIDKIVDYKLSHPTKVVKEERRTAPAIIMQTISGPLFQ